MPRGQSFERSVFEFHYASAWLTHRYLLPREAADHFVRINGNTGLYREAIRAATSEARMNRKPEWVRSAIDRAELYLAEEN